jgi:hypothetical protein
VIRLELEDKEMDYLATLVAQRPIAEAMALYLKLSQQVQAQQRPQGGPAATTPPANAAGGS